MSNEAQAQPSEQTESAKLGNALFNAMNPGSEPIQDAQPKHDIYVPPVSPKHVSSLENLLTHEQHAENAAKNETGEPASNVESENTSSDTPAESGSEEPANTNIPSLELKVKGFRDPQKINLDPNDEKLREYINKGMRFDKLSQEAAQQRKAMEDQIAKYQNYNDLASKVAKLDEVTKLLSEGHGPSALSMLLGDGSSEHINSMIDNEIKYRNASPSERLEMDLHKQKLDDQLREQKNAARIAELEAQIKTRSDSDRQAEYSGYIQDAESRYDLSQWVDDPDVDSLNKMVKSDAMNEIWATQRQREAQGKDPITQRDIRRIFATKAKRLLDLSKRQAEQLADTKITQQSEIATKNAQVASTSNYGSKDVMGEWKKAGGTMTELLDLFKTQGRI
jgi:hypothetical protein